MTADERAQIESRAERSLRRGELAQALASYRLLLAEFPGDEAVRRKLAEIEASVDPAELHSAKANFADAGPVALHNQTPEQVGERLFAIGDYPGAIAAYRRALAQRPGNELVRERLAEIFRLAQATAAAPASPTDAALPPDRDGLFRALLDRISSRRRG